MTEARAGEQVQRLTNEFSVYVSKDSASPWQGEVTSGNRGYRALAIHQVTG